MNPHQHASRLARLPPLLQWTLLLVVSAAISAVLEFLRLPAALLVGPMLAGILFGVNGATLQPPMPLFVIAQGIIGAMIVAAIRPDMAGALLDRWPVILGAVIATLAASSLLGAMVGRWGSLPGTTAIWGSAPGAASAMVLMADAFGADARLVAFMQYLRVIFVSISAALIAGLWVDTSGISPPPVEWFPAIRIPEFAATLLIALAGAVGGRLSRIPGGTLLGPLLIGVPLHLGMGLDLQLPEWLLAASYTVIGWWIGLKFTRPVLAHAARTLPQILAAIFLLIAFCAGIGAVLSKLLDVDPLTAFLATSPGGMDAVAIIAAASRNVDISFVMTLQLTRFLLVLLLGPPVARFIAVRMSRRMP